MGPGKRTHLEHLLLSGMSGVVSFKTLDTFQILTREKRGFNKKRQLGSFQLYDKDTRESGWRAAFGKEKKSNKSILSVLIRGG